MSYKIKQIRELKNIIQEYLATKLDLTKRAYSKIEFGETQLTINRLNEISKILGIEPMEVLGFDDRQSSIIANKREPLASTTLMFPKSSFNNTKKRYKSSKTR